MIRANEIENNIFIFLIYCSFSKLICLFKAKWIEKPPFKVIYLSQLLPIILLSILLIFLTTNNMIDIMIKSPSKTLRKNNLKKLTTQQQKMISQVFVSCLIMLQMFDRHLVTYLQFLQSATISKFQNISQITITVIF